jgi:hypothetical protein
MAASSVFPRQDVNESAKDKKWCGLHLDYAQTILREYNPRIQKLDRLYGGYNGNTLPNTLLWLTHTYGGANRAKYIDYRIGRPKIDIVVNEWAKMPLNASVITINQDAKSAKLDQYELILGAAHAKKDLEKLKEVGVDVLNGAEIPSLEDETYWSTMSFKDKNESVMQTILNNQIKELDLKTKFAKNMQDVVIASECYGQVKIDEDGNTEYISIDPRDRIVAEVDRDPFFKKSPLMGARRVVPVHDILREYRLSKPERDTLDAVRNNAYVSPNGDLSYRNYWHRVGGQLCAEVIHIEWKSVCPIYTKFTPKSFEDLENDPTAKYTQSDIDAREYETNKKKYDEGVKNGDFKIEVQFKEELFEATRIGGMIDTRCRRKPFVLRKVDDPSLVLDYSYCGMCVNTVDGDRISLQEIIENFSNLYNITMYQIMKELNKAKGTIVVYDKAGQPRKKNVKEVLSEMVNDGMLIWDSSATGNMAGRNLDPRDFFKQLDLGVSSSFPALIQLKAQITDALDRISGVNDQRTGQIQASETATNAQSSIQSSRTITDGMTTMMSKYAEIVMTKIVESTKISWGLFKTEKARIILGDDKFKFMEATKEMAYSDYGVYLTDAKKEQEIRQRINQYADALFNAKELRLHDMIDVEMSETLADAKAKLEKSWNDLQKIKTESEDKQLQAQAANQEKQMATQLELGREQREDQQAHEKEMIILEAELARGAETQKSKNKFIIEDHKMTPTLQGEQEISAIGQQ